MLNRKMKLMRQQHFSDSPGVKRVQSLTCWTLTWHAPLLIFVLQPVVVVVVAMTPLDKQIMYKCTHIKRYIYCCSYTFVWLCVSMTGFLKSNQATSSLFGSGENCYSPTVLLIAPPYSTVICSWTINKNTQNYAKQQRIFNKEISRRRLCKKPHELRN